VPKGASFLKEYKVLSIKDKWLLGRPDEAGLTRLLNEEAERGWRVIAICTDRVWGIGRHRDRLVAILERERL
jgi:hypothetical protein